MPNLYQRLLLLIAGTTQRELARHVRYLKIENQILRSKLPQRVLVTPQEQNRLVKFGAKLGKALSELATIVHPDTLRCWIRDSQPKAKKKPVKKGRPRTQEQIRELILRLARENEWGYTRILGELRKLGIQAVSRNTVKNILKENGLDPGPQRGAGTWDEFLKIHAATLWQCDFYLPEATVGRLRGFVELGAWRRNNLRQTPELLFFPWTTVPELPEAPVRRSKPSESESINKPQGIETARRYQALLDDGTVKSRAELARLLGVSRARVTQVLRRLERSEK